MNARRLKLVVVVAVAGASSNWAGSAEATVVSFDSATRAASDVLVIDGVTIATAFGANGQVATVQRIGLGAAGLLSPGFIDRFDSYGDCSSTDGPCHGGDPPVSLSVDGRINSVTLRFYLTLDGPPKSPADVCCAFEWGVGRAQRGVATIPELRGARRYGSAARDA